MYLKTGNRKEKGKMKIDAENKKVNNTINACTFKYMGYQPDLDEVEIDEEPEEFFTTMFLVQSGRITHKVAADLCGMTFSSFEDGYSEWKDYTSWIPE